MATTKEKEYQRELYKNRRDPINDVLKSQGTPEDSLKKMSSSGSDRRTVDKYEGAKARQWDENKTSLSRGFGVSAGGVSKSQGTPEKSEAEMKRGYDQNKRASESANRMNLRREGQEVGGAIGATLGQRYGAVGRYAGEKAGRKIGGRLAEKSTLNDWRKITNKARSSKGGQPAAEAGISGAAEEMANKTVQQVWMIIHELIEENIIIWFEVAFITGPLYLLFIIIRLFIALAGGGRIKVKNIKVKAVPFFTWGEVPVRLFKLSLILLIAGVELSVIGVALWALYEINDSWILSVVADLVGKIADFVGGL